MLCPCHSEVVTVGPRDPSEDRWRSFLESAECLRAYIRRRVDDATDADEVFQDLSLLVLRHSERSSEIEHFPAWCYALARRVLSRHFRSKSRRAKLVNRMEREVASTEDSQGLDPERAASAREIVKLLGDQLSADARELLLQRYVLEESTEEIASRLAQSPTAVRMRLMRLRSAVKTRRS